MEISVNEELNRMQSDMESVADYAHRNAVRVSHILSALALVPVEHIGYDDLRELVFKEVENAVFDVAKTAHSAVDACRRMQDEE